MKKAGPNKLWAALAAAAIFAPGCAAQAEQRPLLWPQQDGVVAYHIVSDAKDAPNDVRVMFKAGGRRLRIEPDNQPGYMLVNRDAGRAEMVMTAPRLVLQIGLGDTIDKYLNDPRAHFERLGPDSVAGRSCTRWAMRSPQAEGEGCVTPEGIILKASGHDRKGEHAAAEAVSVELKPQPEAAFEPPHDYQALSLSNLAKSFRSPQ